MSRAPAFSIPIHVANAGARSPGRPADADGDGDAVDVAARGAVSFDAGSFGADPAFPRPTRRALVQWLAAAGALAAAGCSRTPVERTLSRPRLPERESNATPLFYATACLRDGHALGVLVTTQQGRPTHVEGNADHPASLGRTDAAMQAAILDLWDPDRSTAVRQRRGDGAAATDRPAGLSPSTWPAFLAAWRAQTGGRGGGRRAVHVLTPGFTSPTLAAQLRALLDAAPGSRWYRHDAIDAAPAARGIARALGAPAAVSHRFDRAALVVSFGGDPFADPAAGVRHAADWAAARAAAEARGEPPPRSIAFETAAGLFGARADERHALAPPAIEAALVGIARRLAPELPARRGRVEPTVDTLPAPTLDRIAAELAARRGRAFVLGAATLSAEAHALLQTINRRLGAFDGTAPSLAMNAPPDRFDTLGEPGTLAELIEAARTGRVETLLILGGNPAYTAPTALGFERALESVPFTAHLSRYLDETSVRCTWHLPTGHEFEQWSDARAFDATPTILQPAIAPLYDTRSVHELLALVSDPQASGDAADGRAIVRATWRARAASDAGFEAAWNESLRQGVVVEGWRGATPAGPGGAAMPAFDRLGPNGVSPRSSQTGGSSLEPSPDGVPPPFAPSRSKGRASDPEPSPDGVPPPFAPSPSKGRASGPEPSPDGVAPPFALSLSKGRSAGTVDPRAVPALWADFVLDPSAHDGSRANNAWLQELPRPFSKITWDAALQLGPRTAALLRLTSGDVVRVRHADAGPDDPNRLDPAASAGAAVEAPVWIDPRHAEHAATLPLGYGRRAAGRIGDGLGFDVASLRSADGAPVAIVLERTGRRHAWARTQVEMAQHGREVARSVPSARTDADPKPAEHPSLYPPPDPKTAPLGPQWAMAIDLDACIGCNACTIACQSENNIPVVGADEVANGRAMHWIRVDAYLDEATDRVTTQPVPCMHCENAPCELVCPVGATVHDAEGLNVQVYNRCVGTRFCSNNCPYKVRRFNFRQYSDVTTETLKLMRNPDVTVRSRGVMEKCNYCLQRIARTRRHEQRTGVELATDTTRTACQAACPTTAIRFGDLNDPASAVVAARRSPRHYAMLDELNTRPRTTYLARVDPPAGEGQAP